MFAWLESLDSIGRRFFVCVVGEFGLDVHFLVWVVRLGEFGPGVDFFGVVGEFEPDDVDFYLRGRRL